MDRSGPATGWEETTGDPAVALFDRERVRMVRLAFLLTGSLEVAEDLAQEAFERTLPRIGRLDEPAAYLRTVVVNGARSWHRRRLREPKLPEPIAAGAGEAAIEVWDALRRLSVRRRTALVLRYWADLPIEEIARLMGNRPGTVSSLIHRGLADLRKELNDAG